MDQSKKEKLAGLLKDGGDWEKLEAFEGVYIVKMPKSGRFKAKLALEISPVNSEGKPIKRKGIYITSVDQLEAFAKAFSNPEVMKIMNRINDVNENSTDEAPSGGKVVGKL